MLRKPFCYLLSFMMLFSFSASVSAEPEVTYASDFIRIPIEQEFVPEPIWSNMFYKGFVNYSLYAELQHKIVSINGVSTEPYNVASLVLNTYKPDLSSHRKFVMDGDNCQVYDESGRFIFSVHQYNADKFEDGYAVFSNLDWLSYRYFYSGLYDENGNRIVNEKAGGASDIQRLGRGVYIETKRAGNNDRRYSSVFTTSGEALFSGQTGDISSFYNGSAIMGNELIIDKREVPIVYHGNFIEMDEVAMIVDGKTMVPVRAIAEALGAEVVWEEEAQTVTLKKGTSSVSMTLGSRKASANGLPLSLETAPFKRHDRTFILLRDAAEAIGFTVNWKAEWNMAFIED